MTLQGVQYLRLSGQFWVCLFTLFFLRKNFERTKTRRKQKLTNKTKISKQKTTKTTFFCVRKNF